MRHATPTVCCSGKLQSVAKLLACEHIVDAELDDQTVSVGADLTGYQRLSVDRFPVGKFDGRTKAGDPRDERAFLNFAEQPSAGQIGGNDICDVFADFLGIRIHRHKIRCGER